MGKKSWQRQRKDYVETCGQAYYITGASQRHCKDNKRTNLGQAEDKNRICKGPHRQKVQLYR